MIISTPGVPVGTIISAMRTTVPSGYLYCDGTSVSRATYPQLFEVIGTSCGTVDANTFNLPKLQGAFLRGQSDGTGIDLDVAARTASGAGGNSGDNIGSLQQPGIESHTHTQSAHDHNQQVANGAGSSTTVSNFAGANNLGTPSVNRTGSETPAIQATGGLETRPRNINVRFFIKY